MGTRLALLLALAFAVAGALAAGAFSLSIDDSTCPNVAGEYTNTCPTGTVGVPYSITFKEAEGSGCGPGKQTFHLDSGALPPGLSLELGGTLHGTPTQAGSYQFYIEMREPQDDPDHCRGDRTQKRFTLNIAPGSGIPQPPKPPELPELPKLVIGPEQSGVPVATVGAPYRLAMTANLPDAKAWSIAEGALPPGTALDSTSGIISGTPSAAGSFVFTVLAVINEQQSDTKALAVTVRDPLVLTFPEVETRVGKRVRWEVGVPFSAQVVASGGTGTYIWRLAGALPPGITFGQDGVVRGRAFATGVYRFGLIATDSEGRVAVSAGRMIVAPRLTLLKRPLRRGKVGRPYRARLYAPGGIAPREWERVGGSLPLGMELDPERGILFGRPEEAGRFRIRIRAVDALGVTSGKTYLLRVAAPARKR